MRCPKHPEVAVEKVHLDRFYYPECDHDWLIHPFKADRRGSKK